MRIETEDRWHCINPACGCEVRVEHKESSEGRNPRCTCGALMKKKYTPPVFTYLDFLRLEEAPEVSARKE